MKNLRNYHWVVLVFSSITLAELQFGINKSTQPDKNKNALNQFLLPLEIVDFNTMAAVEYGRIRADLEKKGIPIGPFIHMKWLQRHIMNGGTKIKLIKILKILNILILWHKQTIGGTNGKIIGVK